MKECEDPNCPFHGHLKVRNFKMVGMVVSTKMRHTATVRVDYVKRVPKYERLEKRRSKIHAHVPYCMHVEEGDIVEISSCRKLSKTVSFVVTKILKKGGNEE